MPFLPLFGAPPAAPSGGGGSSSSAARSGYFFARRFGNLAYGSGRAPLVAFGDYCGGYGLARRFGNLANGTGRAPVVVAPRGMCNPDGSLINGEIYLAKRFGNVANGADRAPLVVPICNQCGGSGSGSGSGSDCNRPGDCCPCGMPSSVTVTLDSPCMAAPVTCTLSRVMAETGSCFCAHKDGSLECNYIYEGEISSLQSGGCTDCSTGLGDTWTNVKKFTARLVCGCSAGGTISGCGGMTLCFTYTDTVTNITGNICYNTFPGAIQSCSPFNLSASGTIVCYDTVGINPCNIVQTTCSNCSGSSFTVDVTG